MKKIRWPEKKLEGRVTISRVSGSGGDFIQIRFRDSISGIEFVEFELSLEDFGRAVTGQGYVKGQFSMRGPELVGKRREHKTEIVPLTGYTVADGEEDALLAPFEKDGWIGDRSDLRNSTHRSVKLGADKWGRNVGFIRYVNPETGEPIQL